jgi:hypothetical protein
VSWFVHTQPRPAARSDTGSHARIRQAAKSVFIIALCSLWHVSMGVSARYSAIERAEDAAIQRLDPTRETQGRHDCHLVATMIFLSFGSVFRMQNAGDISHTPGHQRPGTVEFELPEASPGADRQLGRCGARI